VAQSGNGVDIGTIYQLLTQMLARFDQLFAVVNGHTRVLNEHTRVLSEHSRELADLRATMAEMRQEVGQYHPAVTNQGLHYSELEGRTPRIERHLKLEPGE
jgi:chromosome segregation ATPase